MIFILTKRHTIKVFLIILTLISTSLIGCTTVEHNKVPEKSKYKQEEQKLFAELLYNTSDETLVEYSKAVSNFNAVKNSSSVSDGEKKRLYNLKELSLAKILSEKNNISPVCDRQQTLKDSFFIEQEVAKSRVRDPNSDPNIVGDAIAYDILPIHRAACVLRLSLVTFIRSKSL